MATTRFDAVTSSLAQTHSRRGALRLLGLAALSASGLAVLSHEEGQAKKKRKKKGSTKGSSGSGSGSAGSTTSTPPAQRTCVRSPPRPTPPCVGMIPMASARVTRQ